MWRIRLRKIHVCLILYFYRDILEDTFKMRGIDLRGQLLYKINSRTRFFNVDMDGKLVFYFFALSDFEIQVLRIELLAVL